MIISLLLLAVSASAQAPADLDSAIAQAKDAVSVSRARAVKAAGCSDAKELETTFEITLTFADGRRPVELKLAYASCREEGRNDYLPPYTERYYMGQYGYALTIVTDQGQASSEVLLSRESDWIGRFGSIANAKLVSGDSLSGSVELKDTAKAKSSLRNAAVPAYPQLAGCEQAMNKAFGAALRGLDGKPFTGYGQGMALVLLTGTDAYYHYESCDICAEVLKCSLQSREISSVKSAHSISCSDMAPYSKNAVFDSCASGR